MQVASGLHTVCLCAYLCLSTYQQLPIDLEQNQPSVVPAACISAHEDIFNNYIPSIGVLGGFALSPWRHALSPRVGLLRLGSAGSRL